jgi:hypothetical protein
MYLSLIIEKAKFLPIFSSGPIKFAQPSQSTHFIWPTGSGVASQDLPHVRLDEKKMFVSSRCRRIPSHPRRHCFRAAPPLLLSRGAIPRAAPLLLPSRMQHLRGAVCAASSHGRATEFFREADAATLAVLHGTS